MAPSRMAEYQKPILLLFFLLVVALLPSILKLQSYGVHRHLRVDNDHRDSEPILPHVLGSLLVCKSLSDIFARTCNELIAQGLLSHD